MAQVTVCMIRQLIVNICQEIRQAVRTSAFRVSLVFTLVASVITGISMFMIYEASRQEISDQIDARLYSEAIILQRFYENDTPSMSFTIPVVGVIQRVYSVPSMSYCLMPDPHKKLGKPDDPLNTTLIVDVDTNDLCRLPESIDQYRKQIIKTNQPINTDSEHLMRVKIIPLRNDYLLILGYDTYNEQVMLRKMLGMVSFITVILILASFFGSFIISRRIARSIKVISRTARRIVDGDFSERIPVSSKDALELQSLSSNLNHMLDRLENLIQSQRQVTNNIAHDLRSPLNRLRSRMEVALLDEHRDNEELREVIASSVEDVDALLKTFNALLNIAQVESRARDDFEEINVSDLIRDLAEMYEVLNEEETHDFISEVEDNLMAIGNLQLIAQATTNLIDNAVKYTSGCEIALKAYRKNNFIVIAVGDHGEGIPEYERQRIFKRFVRLDSARSTPGNGLGLSLVNAVMNLHGGTVEIKDNHPGVLFKLVFPDKQTFKAMYAQKKCKRKTENSQ